VTRSRLGLRASIVAIAALYFGTTPVLATDYWSGEDLFHSSFCGQYHANLVRPGSGATIGCTGYCGPLGDRLLATVYRSGGTAIRQVFLAVGITGTSEWVIPAGAGYLESGYSEPDSTGLLVHQSSGELWLGRYCFDSDPVEVGTSSTTLVLHFHRGSWLPEELEMRLWYFADNGCFMSSEFGPLEPIHGVPVTEATWGSLKALYVP